MIVAVQIQVPVKVAVLILFQALARLFQVRLFLAVNLPAAVRKIQAKLQARHLQVQLAHQVQVAAQAVLV